MKLNLVRSLRLGTLMSLAGVAFVLTPGASAASRPQSTPPGWRTVEILHTNSSPRVITNLIEVNVPRNIFVNEYRTNWVERTLTNVVDVFMTNLTTLTLTNTWTANSVHTNTIDRYVTNWTTLTLTNEVTYTLTNWETVVVTKTNWIKQPMTQVVEVNVPAPKAATPTTERPGVETLPPAAGDALVLDAVKTSRETGDGQIEIKFRVQLARDAAAALQVQQWRVERDDGAVLFFGQNQEFKRAVPPGRYRVEVKARREADSPLLALRTTLDVTRDAVARR